MTHPATLTAENRVRLEAQIWAQTTARRHLATLARCSVGKCFGEWRADLEWETK